MRAAVLVTGASRGFGRCLALDFTREIAAQDLDLYLWARNDHELEETARLAREEWTGRTKRDGELRTFTQAVDLSDSKDYTAKLETVLAQMATHQYTQIFVVHNAGSLGSLGFAQECATPPELAAYWELNVTSVLWLNKRFLDTFGASREELLAAVASVETTTVSAPLVLVNISSGAGVRPIETLGLYCTGKAAREMHFRVLAAEQGVCSKARVLCYSPGAMDTEMQDSMRESPLLAPAVAKMFGDLKTQNALIAPADSSRCGVKLALSGKFETGSFVGYKELAHLD